MTRTVSPRRVRRNIHLSNSLSLFDWADARDRRFPLPTRLLAIRHRLPLARAALVAELAGVGQEGER